MWSDWGASDVPIRTGKSAPSALPNGIGRAWNEVGNFDAVVEIGGGECQCLQEVFLFQVRIILAEFLAVAIAREDPQDVLDRDTQAADAGLAAELARFDGDAVEGGSEGQEPIVAQKTHYLAVDLPQSHDCFVMAWRELARDGIGRPSRLYRRPIADAAYATAAGAGCLNLQSALGHCHTGPAFGHFSTR